MARILITGSADGLGKLAAQALIKLDHEVVLHARTAERAREAMENIRGATDVFVGDLSNPDETKKLAADANNSGTFDAVIHNAGVYQAPSKTIFAVNTLAPYILTCLIQRPKRLIYLSSGMHMHGSPNLESFRLDTNAISYSDSKLHVVMLAKAVARKWKGVYANSVNPGWVPTKMGGKGAPDDLQKGFETQVWLATSDDHKAKVSGKYFFHQQESRYNLLADDEKTQESLLKRCEQLTGIAFPLT